MMKPRKGRLFLFRREGRSRNMELNESVRSLPGSAKRQSKILQKVEISTIRDLLYYLPRFIKIFRFVKSGTSASGNGLF